MSYLELLWIPAVLGWIPLIYADELSERFGGGASHERTTADFPRQGEVPNPAANTAVGDS